MAVRLSSEGNETLSVTEMSLGGHGGWDLRVLTNRTERDWMQVASLAAILGRSLAMQLWESAVPSVTHNFYYSQMLIQYSKGIKSTILSLAM